MNYVLAIAVNRAHLARIVAGMIQVLGGLSVDCIARHVHLSVLGVLRPVESATRRLIAILAHGLVVQERAKRSAPAAAIPKGGTTRAAAFPLFDPRRKVDPRKRRAQGYGPNVGDFDGSGRRPPPRRPEPQDGEPVNAATVVRRLIAVQTALDDLPRQARRLARAMMKQTAPIRAMRPGRPPGHRAPRGNGRWLHPADEVLADCQQLALMALNDPPTMMRAPP